MSQGEVPIEGELEELELEDVIKEVYRQMAQLQREMEQRFRDIWSHLSKLSLPITFGFFEPAFDIVDEDDELVLYIDVPGFSRDEIKIRVTEDAIEIRAEKSEERKAEEKERRYIVRQRVYEGLYKRIHLPCKVRPEAARAKLVNGVLEIRIPKSEAKREVEITVE